MSIIFGMHICNQQWIIKKKIDIAMVYIIDFFYIGNLSALCWTCVFMEKFSSLKQGFDTDAIVFTGF